MCEFIREVIGNYVVSRWDIPDKIKETVTENAINKYMKIAEKNPEDYCNKMNKEIVYEIMEEIKKVYPEIKPNTSAAAGGSRRRRHRRSTRTSKKGKKYSITRRRK